MTQKTFPYILSLLFLVVLTNCIAQDKISKKAPAASKKVEAQIAIAPETTVNDSTDALNAEAADLALADSLAAVDSLGNDSINMEVPYPERAVLKIDNLLKDKIFETSQVGLMVWDLDADSVIYAYNEKQLLRPASTMKVLTAITALDQLGTKYRYSTSIYSVGECDSTSLHGNLYVKGGMDPSFSNYEMDCFIEGVAKLHVDTIKGKLVADLSFKDDKKFGEGWCWDDKNYTLTPLLYNKKDNFLEILRSRLKAQGIVVMDGDSIGRVPQNAVLLAERFSGIESILYKMMKESDNLYAESMLYQIGAIGGKQSSAKNAQSIEKQVMKKAGLDPDTYRLADGSGLSLYNYLSAECEVKLLRYAYNNKKIFGTFCQSLPSAGVDGTLKKRMKHEPVLDNVRAKTGTLTGVSSLAGYCISPEGHMLAFCIINQSMMRAQGAKNFQDRVCMAICK